MLPLTQIYNLHKLLRWQRRHSLIESLGVLWFCGQSVHVPKCKKSRKELVGSNSWHLNTIMPCVFHTMIIFLMALWSDFSFENKRQGKILFFLKIILCRLISFFSKHFIDQSQIRKFFTILTCTICNPARCLRPFKTTHHNLWLLFN